MDGACSDNMSAGPAGDDMKLLEREAAECRRLLQEAPEDVELLFLLSGIESSLGNPSAAARCIEKVMALRPESPEPWLRYGEILLGQEMYDDASNALKRAVELNPLDEKALLGLGIALTRSGRLPEAIDIYKQALSIKQDYPEVLYNLGGILENQNRLAESAVCFERAVQISPHFAAGFSSLGRVCLRRGRLDDAAAFFRRALELQPDLPETLNHLGMVLVLQNAHGEAVECFMRAVALRPNNPEACYHLGVALAGCGRQTEAEVAYRRALSLKPDYPGVLNNLGIILRDRGEAAEAVALLRKAVALQPNFPEAFNNLGMALGGKDLSEESMACFRQALALRPDYPEAIMNLANALGGCGRVAEAVQMCKRALSLRPDYPEALVNLGSFLRLQNELEESVACLRRAVELQPNCPEAINNLAMLLNDLGQLPEAISLMERAVSLRSDHGGFHRNLGMCLLTAGRFEEGWRECEWRWRCPDLAPAGPPFSQPPWRGEAAEDRVLFLYAEQGFGDTLQFCRYVPLAAARGLRITLMVQPPLMRLMKSLAGVERLLGMDQPVPPFDFQCPLLSLPLAFDTKLANIPADVPYLHPEREAVLAWKDRLPAVPPGALRVGLVWTGNVRWDSSAFGLADRNRSLAPEMLAPLWGIHGVQFYSLQKDGPSAPAEWHLIDFMDECRDFSDTAALVANLDLVVSVDTAVAHLAGAIGKPVWVLARFDCCWRWLRDREDSPWYPTVRLFRQPRPGDWESVISCVRTELEEHLG